MENLHQYLFIDIETVSDKSAFEELSEPMQGFWQKKMSTLKLPLDMSPDEGYKSRAAIYSEFAKVICISIGCLVQKEGSWKIYLKSITGDDEKVVLGSFCTAINLFIDREKDIIFCGHNIKEFDLPFLCRRMVINNMALPNCLDTSARKPWEVSHADTLEMWRFGDRKSYTSLGLLAEILGIPTPKDDIDGSMVGQIYWEEKDLHRIGVYCAKDVVTSAKVFLRLKNLPITDPEPVYI